MNKCPLTYLPCGENRYSELGLHTLHPNLRTLHDLPFSAREQRSEAAGRMNKMSIQGVQPKLSAVLDTKNAIFKFTNTDGRFIIKPQSDVHENMPENEDLSMRMARVCGLETPWHGLIWSNDGSLSYVIRRFDRVGKNGKLPVEDFAQLAGKTRGTKYDFTTERLIGLLTAHCTFPAVEKEKFFRLLLFCFLIGNEDMHLKNFSLITRDDRVELSPAYDLLNSTIALGKTDDELALMLAGKRKEFKVRELVDYLGCEKLALQKSGIDRVLGQFERALPDWLALIERSFLPEKLKTEYRKLLLSRCARLNLTT